MASRDPDARAADAPPPHAGRHGPASDEVERFRALADSTAVFELDENATFTYASPLAIGLLAVDGDTVVGRSLLEDVHAGDRPAWQRRLAARAAGPTRSTIWRMRSREGSWRWLEASLVSRRTADGAIRFVGTVREVTAESRVYETLARLGTIVRNGLDMIAEVDARGQILRPLFKPQGARPSEDLEGRSIEDFVHPDDITVCRKGFAQAVETGRGGPIEIRARAREGSWRWLEAVCVKHWDRDETPSILVIARDVTQRKHRQTRMANLAARFQAIIDLGREQVIEVDEEGVIRWAAKGASLFGYTIRDLEGHSCFDFPHPEDVALLQKAHARALSEGRSAPVVCRVPTRDGSVRWVESTFLLQREREGETRLLGIGRDVSEQRQDEQRFRLLAEHGLDTVTEVDAEGRIVLAGSGHERVLGLTVDQLVGTHLIDRVHPDDRDLLVRGLSEARPGKSNRVTFRAMDADGSWRWIETSGASYLNANNELRHLGVGRDVTDHLVVESALRDSRDRLARLASRLQDAREEERSEVAREIHDQLGQQLTGLKLNLSSVAATLEKERAAQERLQQILGEVENLVDSVRDLSSRLRPAVLDQLGLVAAIETQARELALAAGWRLELDVPAELLPPARERDIACFRIAQEALTNAARHAGAGTLRLRLTVQDSRLILAVADDGRGISPAERANLDSVGLTGMRERARTIGGRLSIEVLPEGGTEVRLEVPLQARQLD